MYQKFTQEMPKEYCHVMDNEISMRFLTPRKETLAFILQFASSYHVEKKLPLGLAEMMLN